MFGALKAGIPVQSVEEEPLMEEDSQDFSDTISVLVSARSEVQSELTQRKVAQSDFEDAPFEEFA